MDTPLTTERALKSGTASGECKSTRNLSQEMHRVEVLGVPITAVDMGQAIDRITRSIAEREGRYICAADVHSVMQAQRNEAHMKALRGAYMVLPDGTPVVWAVRAHGGLSTARVPGPDLMLQACRHGVELGWRHFFYGGATGIAEELARSLRDRFPGLQVAGTMSPPFRILTQDEKQRTLEELKAASPDIVWVGLGCPKQEVWMHENAPALPGTMVIGVGAAFDFHSNTIPRAPAWMRDHALEWLHRLSSEPTRLWRRYLLLGPEFMLKVLAELCRERLSSTIEDVG